jgi:hypothetical protein
MFLRGSCKVVNHDAHNLCLTVMFGVEGSCLHRPENWLMRQLNDEPKLVYEVGFIRKKGKATAREVQRSPEAHGSLHR